MTISKPEQVRDIKNTFSRIDTLLKKPQESIDYTEIARLYESIMDCSPKAMYERANMYICGYGGDINYGAGISLLKQASAAGYEQASGMLDDTIKRIVKRLDESEFYGEGVKLKLAKKLVYKNNLPTDLPELKAYNGFLTKISKEIVEELYSHCSDKSLNILNIPDGRGGQVALDLVAEYLGLGSKKWVDSVKSSSTVLNKV